MRPSFQLKLSSLKPVWASLLAVLVILLTFAATSERLHFQLHADGDAAHAHGPCAVCAIVKGHVDAPGVVVSEVFAALSVAWTLPPPQTLALASFDLLTAPNRGPPASVSSQS